ncbi:GNAT family N-acetyltransferase [Leptospira alstonii]|uniref:GNAT family N-acetyltransferase n=1 Tax=Leptospira alstonii TaxID=28452 RepID=UPI0007735DD8|nr:GNAT family protein [Leptospira alstonii]
MINSDLFRGERIFLRELNSRDIDDRYLSWFKSNSQVTEFLESKDLTYESVTKFIQDGKETKSFFIYAICMLDSNLHIGNLKIGNIDKNHMISDLVVVIGDQNFWRKGIATEAIKLGNQIAFEIYDIRKLSGGMYSDNIASIKCYTKAGWVEEARLKGHYLLNGKVLDRVCVSCFNPKYFKLDQKEN